ncbi:M4 family metallopeptidase [Bacillus spongiae]|uniref:Neutral metalloproteinase n=1 Tax=Bacillus spongiae TaxID=2683610 RepID=A0ABU8HH42_9BACI
MKKRKKLVTTVIASSLALGTFTTPASLSVFAKTPNLGEMKEEKVHWSQKVQAPEFISGNLTEPSDQEPETILFNYIDQKEKLFAIKGSAKNSFVIKEKKQDELEFTFIRLQQMYKGTPVFGATLTAHIDKDGVLTALSGTILPELDKKQALRMQQKVTKNQAVDIAEKALKETLSTAPAFESKPKAELVVFNDGEVTKYAYVVSFLYHSPELGNVDYFVDAISGEIMTKTNNIHAINDTVGTGTGVLGDEKSLNTSFNGSTYLLIDNTRGDGIFTYDANNSFSAPGTLWEDNDNQFTAKYDRAAVDAHYYAGVTYDFFKDSFDRNSFDDKGAAIKSTVHYGNDLNNAYWNGTQMLYGDGDGTIFAELSGALDVVGHELTHAVTEHTADLVSGGESGTINESMSDIFGTLIEFYEGNDPDWVLGEDVFTPNIPNDSLRSLLDPTQNGSPDHYSNRSTDASSPYVNIGILNKAAYLLSEGGTHYGITVAGIGTEKLGKIYYRTLTQYLTSTATFSQLRSSLIQSATDLYGEGSAEVAAATAAFDAVGIE